MPGQSRYRLLRNLLQEVRLAWALLRDPRVPTWPKVLIPTLWLAYLIFPVDILPDIVPVLGEVDDLMLFLILVRLFIAMSPQDVVQDIEARLRGRKGASPKPSVIEGSYRVLDE